MFRIIAIAILLLPSTALACVKPALLAAADGARLTEMHSLQSECKRGLAFLRNGDPTSAVSVFERLVQSKELLSLPVETALAEAMYRSGAPVEDALVAWEMVADASELKGARIFELVQRLPHGRAKGLLAQSPDRASAQALQRRVRADRSGTAAKRQYISPGTSIAGRIGVLLPLTGRTARFGQAVLRGIRAALRDDTILYVRDTGGRATDARRYAESLVSMGVTAIVGPINRTATNAAIKVCQQHSVPLLRLDLAPAKPTHETPWAFTAGLSRGSQSRAQVNYAMRRGWQRFAVVNADNRYGQAVSSEFAIAIAAAGGTLVHSIAYPAKAKSLTDVAKQLKEHEFDVLFVAESRSRAGRVLRFIAREDIWTAGLKSPVVPTGDVRYVQVMGPAEWMDVAISKDDSRYFQGVVLASEWPGPDASAVSGLLERSMRMFGKRPGKFEAVGYDAISMLQTISGRSRSAMRKGLLRGKGFNGLLGWCRFTERGELQRAVKLYRATKNTFTLVAAKRGRN